VCVAVFIQHAMRMCHIVVNGLSGSTMFCPHYLIDGTVLEKKKKKKVIENKMYVFVFSKTFV